MQNSSQENSGADLHPSGRIIGEQLDDHINCCPHPVYCRGATFRALLLHVLTGIA